MVFFIENRTGLRMVEGIEDRKTGIIYPILPLFKTKLVQGEGFEPANLYRNRS